MIKWMKVPRLLRLGKLRTLMKGHARYLNLVIIFFCSHIGACLLIFSNNPCTSYSIDQPFESWTYYEDVNEDLVVRHPNLGWECTQERIPTIYMKALHSAAAVLCSADIGKFGGYYTAGGFSETAVQEVASFEHLMMDTPESAAAEPEAARVRAMKRALLYNRFPQLATRSEQQLQEAATEMIGPNSTSGATDCLSRAPAGWGLGGGELNDWALSVGSVLHAY